MGNSSSSSSSSSASVMPANSRSLLSENELQQIRKWVAREYPWIPTVNESMLITDVRKPDCPIVQANIEFEMMTGYPAAEILGRNCRFLQGPGSSAATVTRIRNAVKSGGELNVELLNYTKYGVPFVNAFTMYPIHRNGTPSGELRYFIAIQKDVTQIKSLPAQPADWNPQEVVVWLERMGLLDAARNLVNAAIDGAGLLALTDASLSENYDISDPEPILEAVRLLTTSPPPATASSSSGTSALYTPVTQSLTAAPDWWNVGEGSNQRFLVRVLRDGNHDESPFLVTATGTTELATVRAAIDKHHGKPCNLKLIDTKNPSSAGVPLTKALWNQMRSELAGQEMTLSAFPQKVKLSEREQAALEASAAGVLVVSGDRVIFANSTLLATIRKSAEQVSGEHFGRIVSNFSLDDHTSGFRKCFVVHNDGAQIGMLGDMRRTRRGKLAVLTLVPLGVFGSNES